MERRDVLKTIAIAGLAAGAGGMAAAAQTAARKFVLVVFSENRCTLFRIMR